MSTAPRVQVRRVQDEAQEDDGQRILVDRVWPRGVSKDKARLDLWCKEVAPSTELRRWYQHDPDKWQEFARRYRDELQDAERSAAYDDLRERATRGRVTLLTESRRDDISQAAVLADLLNRSLPGPD